MATTYKHPGVYIEELPGPQPIIGVSTQVGAFVGIAEKGPVDTPVLITSWSDFSEMFGSFLWNRYLAFAVYAFFAEGGQICYVIRVDESPALSPQAPYRQEKLPSVAMTGGTLKFDITASSAADWTNVSVEIAACPTTTNPSPDLFTINLIYTGANPIPKQPEASSGGQTGTGTARGPGEIELRDYIRVNQIEGRAVTSATGAPSSYIYVLETYPGLNFSEIQKAVTASGLTGNEASAEIQSQIQSLLDTTINAKSLFIRALNVKVSGTSISAPSPGTHALSTGTGTGSGTPITYTFGTPASDGQKPKGFYAFDSIQDVNILVIPDLTTVYAPGDSGSPESSSGSNKLNEIIEQALDYCEERTNLFFVIDAPRVPIPTTGMEIQNVVKYRSSFNSEYGALYFPWMAMLNPVTSMTVTVPPSGSVAGAYAETDDRVGVWKAPAGTQDGLLKLAVDLNYQVSDNDLEVLNPNDVNALRNFYQIGNVIWGTRTLSAETEWMYVPVRRLLSYIEMSLERASMEFVFEPNSTQLWTQIHRDFSDFLTNLWRAGALFGSSSDEAFFVTVDASNNTPSTRAQGILYIDVGVAPVRPAEFVVIRIRQTVPPS